MKIPGKDFSSTFARAQYSSNILLSSWRKSLKNSPTLFLQDTTEYFKMMIKSHLGMNFISAAQSSNNTVSATIKYPSDSGMD